MNAPTLINAATLRRLVVIVWILIGAANASAIWFGFYMYDNQKYRMIQLALGKCNGSWELYGESSVFGLRVKCKVH